MWPNLHRSWFWGFINFITLVGSDFDGPDHVYRWNTNIGKVGTWKNYILVEILGFIYFGCKHLLVHSQRARCASTCQRTLTAHLAHGENQCQKQLNLRVVKVIPPKFCYLIILAFFVLFAYTASPVIAE